MSVFEREKAIRTAFDTKKVVRTAAYIRVSTEEQAKHGFSIEAQKEGLKKYAEEKGYRIVEWYIDDGKSARKKVSKRKEYIRLIEDAKQGKFEMIIFKCLDRWFRNISEYYKTQSILDEKCIDWECSEEDYDTTTRDGRWKLHIYLMLAQDESDKTSERINYVFQNKIKNKEAITGSQPYGFMVKEIDGHKRVVKDKNVSQIVDDVFDNFELFNSKRATLYFIQDKYDVKIEYKLIGNILTNPYYYGHYRGVDDYIWGESYITKERFDKIQRMLEKNVKARKVAKNRDYIFSGLLVCSECGCKLASHHNVQPLADGSTKVYLFYRCNRAAMNYKCEAKGTFSEIKLEQRLIRTIEEEIEDYICEYELDIKKEKKPEVDTKSIEEEIQRLNISWRKGRMKETEYDYEFERLQRKLEKAQEKLPEKHDLIPLYDFLNSGWKDIYSTLTSVEKRALWRSVIDEIEVNLKKKEFKIKFI